MEEKESFNLSEITSAINSVDQDSYHKNKVFSSNISTTSSDSSFADRWASDRNNYLQKSCEIVSQHQKHQSQLVSLEYICHNHPHQKLINYIHNHFNDNNNR